MQEALSPNFSPHPRTNPKQVQIHQCQRKASCCEPSQVMLALKRGLCFPPPGAFPRAKEEGKSLLGATCSPKKGPELGQKLEFISLAVEFDLVLRSPIFHHFPLLSKRYQVRILFGDPQGMWRMPLANGFKVLDLAMGPKL